VTIKNMKNTKSAISSVTPTEAARALRLSKARLLAMIDGFQVLTIRSRGRRLIPPSELAAQLRQLR
jgi:hypothetical protein